MQSSFLQMMECWPVIDCGRTEPPIPFFVAGATRQVVASGQRAGDSETGGH